MGLMQRSQWDQRLQIGKRAVFQFSAAVEIGTAVYDAMCRGDYWALCIIAHPIAYEPNGSVNIHIQRKRKVAIAALAPEDGPFTDVGYFPATEDGQGTAKTKHAKFQAGGSRVKRQECRRRRRTHLIRPCRRAAARCTASTQDISRAWTESARLVRMIGTLAPKTIPAACAPPR